ncbi:MAG: glutamine-hydrolyzing GMP synthase [Chloroflexi bacterium]|nr:MAG: glutamine-hydrolyzing GMP synthase [Chloroflexota bacterium]
MTRELIAVVDLGSQYAQLIARRVRECRAYGELVPHTTRWEDLADRNVKGVILSGGPASVYEPGAPRVDPRLIDGRVPVLGICYGMQLMAHELGGEVVAEGKREYGPAMLEISEGVPIFAGLRPQERAWMSHGDSVRRLPKGFHAAGRTVDLPVAAMTDGGVRFGVQFHPEVQHTPSGMDVLRNFVLGVCGAKGDWTPASFIDEALSDVRARIGERRALCALSGGVDSAVAAALVARAIGDRLVCVFVDTGLLRESEPEQVVSTFQDRVTLVPVDAERRFLERLAGVTDPELKRAIIGEEFVRVFEAETERHGPIDVLVQGTIYPDVIESKAASDTAARIKTHHNVGGLPADMRLEVVEPLRRLFKDEVRRVGVELGLPEDILWRHPFPGPGLAVRIIGEITPERLDTLRRADAIFLEELREAGLYKQVAQAFAVLTPVKSVGVMGDYRTYGDVVALRAVTTDDFMTADWARLPHELLARVASRIVNEVPAVNRVVYDITSKPPGTIEWE